MKRNYHIALLMALCLCSFAAIGRSVLGHDFQTYTLPKNESLYAVARSQSWNYDTLCAYNPTASAESRKGMTVWYPADTPAEVLPPASLPSDTVLHVLGIGENLLDVGRHYNISVADIFLLNPTLNENSSAAGTIIKVVPDMQLRYASIVTDTVPAATAFKQYRAQKDDSWYGIASKEGLPLEFLIELNGYTPNNAPLSKGDYVSVPVIDSVPHTRYVMPGQDERELTSEGRQAIYDSIHAAKARLHAMEKPYNVAILTRINGNVRRDVEFLKGWMIAADSLKSNGKKINIAVYDLTADSVSDLTPLLASGKLDDRDVIVYTHEKDFPQELSDFGRDKGIYVVNPFNLSTKAHETNSHALSMLTPSEMFNREVATSMLSLNPLSTFIFIGTAAEQERETVDALLKTALDEQGRSYISLAEPADLLDVSLDRADSYVICPTANKKSEIEEFLKVASKLHESIPDISVLGRPGWIQQMDKMKKEMSSVNTYIPSRFYADEESEEAKDFNARFRKAFGHKPQHTWPVFSYFGFDLGLWIMQTGLAEIGTDTPDMQYAEQAHPLQNLFEMVQLPDAGYVNRATVLIYLSANNSQNPTHNWLRPNP